MIDNLLNFPGCKFVRPLGLNGSVYDKGHEIGGRESKYPRIARPVLKEISKSKQNLSCIILANSVKSKKNSEINESTVQQFKSFSE